VSEPVPQALLQSVEQNPQELASVLGSFNELVGRLQSTHEMLRNEVARLNDELGETKQRLRRSQELAALGEMAAGIAHEIRNPLGSIKLYASILEQDLDHLPEHQEVATKISRAVTGLDSIVSDVLDFAKELTLCLDQHSADDLLAHATESCRAQLDASEAELTLLVDDDLQIFCDSALLHRALINVIRNAAEAIATNPTSSKTIKLSATPGHLRTADGDQTRATVLCIEDSGDGIPQDVIDRMFNPFFTTRPTGTGLGLAIVHRIVDAHNGSVQVSNRPEGGARVSLVLPIQQDTDFLNPQSKDAAHEDRTGC
jgi:signal transduction histidine kinase